MSGYSQMLAAECPLDSSKDKEKGGVGGALLNSRLTRVCGCVRGKHSTWL